MNRYSLIKNYLDRINLHPLTGIVIRYDYFIENKVDIEFSFIGNIESLKVLKDGRVVIFVSDDTLRIIDKNDQAIIKNQVGFMDMIILPDDRIAIIGDNNRISIINPNTRKHDIIFDKHEYPINNILKVIYKEDGTWQLLSIDSKYILIWDPITGEIHNKSYSPQSRFLTQISNDQIAIYQDNYIRIYNMNSRIKTDLGVHRDVIYATLTSDRKLISISDRLNVKKWNLDTKKSQTIYDNEHYFINKILSVNSEYIIVVFQTNMLFFNLNSGSCDFLFYHNSNYINNLVILPDTRIAISLDNIIAIFEIDNLQKGKCILINPGVIINTRYQVNHINLLPDKRLIYSTHEEDGEIDYLIVYK